MRLTNPKFYIFVLFVVLQLGITGCLPQRPPNSPGGLSDNFVLPPRPRRGSYATSTMGTKFNSSNKLGRHGYYYSFNEQNGIIYTCRGGHIDLAHVRKTADWTAYLASQSYKKIMKGKRKMSFKLIDPSQYYVTFEYPKNWKLLDETQKVEIAHNASIELGSYLAYTATTWHEILTWFGYKFPGIYPEYPSAFSWEDSYSNLLGAHVGARALRDREHNYDKAVTIALDQAVRNLKGQSGSTARKASDQVRGQWFKGDFLFFVEISGRNFDIGGDDGKVTPSVIPNVQKCEASKSLLLPVPMLSKVEKNGINVHVEIKPNEWEAGKIFRIVNAYHGKKQRRIVPDRDFPIIIDHLKNNHPDNIISISP